jgi:hypothetical protein
MTVEPPAGGVVDYLYATVNSISREIFMSKRLRPVFWAESLLAGIAGFLAILTAVWPTWIEGVTGFDPDKQSGSLEWILVAGCGLAALLLGTLARREWRGAATAASA